MWLICFFLHCRQYDHFGAMGARIWFVDYVKSFQGSTTSYFIFMLYNFYFIFVFYQFNLFFSKILKKTNFLTSNICLILCKQKKERKKKKSTFDVSTFDSFESIIEDTLQFYSNYCFHIFQLNDSFFM